MSGKFISNIRKLMRNPTKALLVLEKLGVVNWLPDYIFLTIKYRAIMNKKPNLVKPITYNEKLQWLKLHDRKSEYTEIADKYQVRNYISNIIGDEYLIPLLGTWDTFGEIDFKKLPNQFVLKCTHDSGGVIVCTDKSELDINKVKRKIDKCMKKNFYYTGREWPYKNIKPKIICEKFIVDKSGTELKDYKFMCFNGEPKIIQVISERKKGSYLINHFDLEWNEIDIPRKSIKRNPKVPAKPKNLSKMIEISKILSRDMPFVRIDLYETEEGIYFGEITFFPVSGFMGFEREEDDKLLGSWIELPKKISK